MRILFRADASVTIGLGHFMRCLHLAKAFVARGSTVYFLSHDLPGHLVALLSQAGIQLQLLPEFKSEVSGDEHDQWVFDWLQRTKVFDWVVVDHYELDVVWEQSIKPYVKKLAVFDDMTGRRHDCDVLIDVSGGKEGVSFYKNLVPEFCEFCVGEQYAVISNKTLECRRENLKPLKSIDSVLLFLGGGFSVSLGQKLLSALERTSLSDVQINFVLARKVSVDENDFCFGLSNLKIYDFIPDMSELLSQSDFYIGSGGMITWDRSCLGLTGLVFSVADNQLPGIQRMEKIGGHRFLGRATDVGVDEIALAITDLTDSLGELNAMREASFQAIDGQGAARIVKLMLEE